MHDSCMHDEANASAIQPIAGVCAEQKLLLPLLPKPKGPVVQM